MMNAIKNIVILIALVLTLGLGYYLYMNNGSFEMTEPQQDLNLEAESAELIRKIDSIKRITLDRDIFSDPRFTSLRSFANPVPTHPVGRENPFEPSE